MNLSNLINNAKANMSTSANLANNEETTMQSTTSTNNEGTTMTNLPMKELIAMYNEQAEKPRKSFKNKQAAIEAIEALTTTTVTDECTTEEAAVEFAEEANELCPACEADMVEELGCTCNGVAEVASELPVEEPTEEPVLKLSDLINTNALSSTVTATIYHELEDAPKAVLTGCAIVDAVELSDNMGVPESFMPMVHSVMETAKVQAMLSADGKRETVTVAMEYNQEEIEAAIIACGLGNEDGTMGDRLVEMLEQRTEAYAPALAEEGVVRRFVRYSLEKGQGSKLLDETVAALEETKYTIDAWMLSIANQVQAKMGGMTKDDEGYVLTGCNKMSAANSYVSEFKADARIRLYQAACHGPNGQASDRSRALMDLAEVEYTLEQVPAIKKAIRGEIMDMVSVDTSAVGALMTEALKDPVTFIMAELALPKKVRRAAKPWSFVKAANIWSELMKGNMPYIGMAVGLDAKCSGPQYGGLMVGDAEIAQACGFSLEQMEDAYHRAITSLIKAGFTEFTMKHRNLIKKPFMGIFYGQGWAAYTDIAQMNKDEQEEIVAILYPNGVANDDTAKRFHKAITASFGKKMVAVRARFKEFMGAIEGRVQHFMPDGASVRMNYKVKVNIGNEMISHDVACPDVTVTTENNTYKFIKFAMKTRQIHHDDFIRNGFVNMIQATDALIARLIIIHLKRLGAKHIISVHDCFRVNVTEMHLLEQAIKLAYMDLFGNTTIMHKPAHLPMGNDILALYFKGANKQVVNEEDKVVPITQFMQMKKGGEFVRKFQAVKGTKLSHLIMALGQTYYFAK